MEMRTLRGSGGGLEGFHHCPGNTQSGGRLATPTHIDNYHNHVVQLCQISGCAADTEVAEDRTGPLPLGRREGRPWEADSVVLVFPQPCSVHTWEQPSPTSCRW